MIGIKNFIFKLRVSLEKKALAAVLALAVCAGLFIFLNWQMTVMAMGDGSLSSVDGLIEIIKKRQGKSTVRKVMGLYLTAYSAGNPKKIDEIIKLIDATELNAAVIDIKDYSGLILYDTQVKLAKDLKLKDNRLGNVKNLIKKLHNKGIYVIARQTVFQDPALAEKKPAWALKKKSGGVWRDRKGLSWVDPAKKEIWDYNLAIAKEAVILGFDEINFDYMRFPSDGNMAEVVYGNAGKKKYEVMREFYDFLSMNFTNEPVWISVDMFGFVMEKKGEDDMSIGQRLSDALPNFDYICPMMYPSHYPSGHLKLKNPAEHPALVIENGIAMGLPVFTGKRARFRPWLQAFDLGATYDAAKIRAQIDAVEGNDNAGWLLWNASNRYTKAGLE